MKTIPVPHALVALGFAALAVAAAVFVPPTMVDKLSALLERIARDPAGATVIVSVIAGAVTTLRAAWVRRPPSDGPPPAPPSDQDGPPTRPRRPTRADTTPTIPRVALVLGLLLPGCGASALSTHASIAVGLEASLGVSRGLIAPACDVALTACHGDQACIDGVAHDCRSAVAAWEVTHAAVLGYVEALQAASLAADEGAVLDALAMVLATTARTWAATVAALATVGVTLPRIPDAAAPLLAAIGGWS